VLDDFASHSDVKSSRTRRERIAAAWRTLPSMPPLTFAGGDETA
jgi:hypothetical protein